MAGQKALLDFIDSTLTGSEEMFEFFCHICRTEKHVEAVGYCQQCSLYLCDTCANHHGKLPLTAKHRMLDKASMPKTSPPTYQTSDDLTETCKDHPGNILEYYCKTHLQICCSACFTMGHATCPDKIYISDICGGIENSQECKTLRLELDRLIVEITKQLSIINDDVQTNEQWHSGALANIREYRQRINKLIDEIEEDSREQLLKLYQNNEEILKKTSNDCQALLSEVQTMAADIDRNTNTGNANQLFVQLKLFRQRSADVQRQFNETGSCKPNQFAFKHGENLQQTKTTLSALWSIALREGETPTKARFVREFSVKAGDDTEDCNISGIVVLAGGRVVVTDYDNKAVKLINTNSNRITSRLPVSSEPFDITKMVPNVLAIALGNEEKIQILSVSDSLSITNTIKTPGANYNGLCYDGTNFITASTSQKNIQIIDMTGSILSKLSLDSNGQQLFTAPAYVAQGRKKDVVYVTDYGVDTVTCMTTRGHVNWVFTHDKLQSPLGVIVGQDDSVYVSSRDTHTVYQLSATGSLNRLFLSKEQGLASNPTAISFDEDGDMLYISSSRSVQEKRNYIQLYQLE